MPTTFTQAGICLSLPFLAHSSISSFSQPSPWIFLHHKLNPMSASSNALGWPSVLSTVYLLYGWHPPPKRWQISWSPRNMRWKWLLLTSCTKNKKPETSCPPGIHALEERGIQSAVIFGRCSCLTAKGANLSNRQGGGTDSVSKCRLDTVPEESKILTGQACTPAGLQILRAVFRKKQRAVTATCGASTSWRKTAWGSQGASGTARPGGVPAPGNLGFCIRLVTWTDQPVCRRMTNNIGMWENQCQWQTVSSPLQERKERTKDNSNESSEREM